MDQAETSAAIPAAPQAWADARAAYPEYYASVCPDVERILAGPIAAESLAAYVYGLFGRDGTPVSVGATAAAGAAVLDTLFKHRAAQVDAERDAPPAADGWVRTEFGPHVGDVVRIGGCPLGRHVGVTGTVTARDGLWVRVAVGDGGFCEPDSVERLDPELLPVTELADVVTQAGYGPWPGPGPGPGPAERLMPLAWAVLDAEDRVNCVHATRGEAVMCMPESLTDGSTRVAPLVSDGQTDDLFHAPGYALVDDSDSDSGDGDGDGDGAIRVYSFLEYAKRGQDRFGGTIRVLRVADLDEVATDSSPCPDCTAGVVRVPGTSGATFDCGSCDGTGSVLVPGTRVP